MTDSHFHTGPPAFTTLLPPMPGLEPVPATLARRIEAYCGLAGEVHSLGAIGATIAGRYVVSSPGGTALFLKIFDQRILELQRHSDRVAAFLGRDHLPVVLPLAGEPRAFAPGYCGALFPYVDARFSLCDETELPRLATVLGNVHRSLRRFDAGEIREAGDEMHQRLLAIAPGAGVPPEFAAAVRNAQRLYGGGPLAIRDAAQMIHGDCNYTNVLVDRQTGELFLIDFEESRAAWLNPLFDVAKVIERFVLVPAAKEPLRLATAILESYVAAGGHLNVAVDFRRILNESNSRALLILCDKARDGLLLPDAEWRKFVDLTALAEQHAALLDSVSRAAADMAGEA